MKLRQGLLMTGLLSMVACGAAEHIPSTSLNSQVEQNDSFALLSANILQPKCFSCHSGNQPAGGIDLSSYTAILSVKGVVSPGNPAHSSLYTEVQSGDMPDGGPVLPANEVQAIHDWIAANAPDGPFDPGQTPTAPPVTPPVPITATYTQVQKLIFNVSCTACHSGPRPSGKIDLSSYAKLMANHKAGLIVPGSSAKSLLYTEVERGNMPPRGTRVSAADVMLLQQWIDSGAPNN